MLGLIHPMIYFPLYEKSKIYFKSNWDKDSESLKSRYVLVSACGSKAIASAFTYPHEVIRARLQDRRSYETNSNYPSRFIDVLKEIRGEGVRAFYAGFFTNLMRIMPHYAIIFVLYEYFSQTFHKILD